MTSYEGWITNVEGRMTNDEGWMMNDEYEVCYMITMITIFGWLIYALISLSISFLNHHSTTSLI